MWLSDFCTDSFVFSKPTGAGRSFGSHFTDSLSLSTSPVLSSIVIPVLFRTPEAGSCYASQHLIKSCASFDLQSLVNFYISYIDLFPVQSFASCDQHLTVSLCWCQPPCPVRFLHWAVYVSCFVVNVYRKSLWIFKEQSEWGNVHFSISVM